MGREAGSKASTTRGVTWPQGDAQSAGRGTLLAWHALERYRGSPRPVFHAATMSRGCEPASSSSWRWMSSSPPTPCSHDPAYLHSDRACLHRDTAETLVPTAASAALQGDAGRSENVLHLVGELGNDIHQLLQRPAETTIPDLSKGQDCKRQGWGALKRCPGESEPS